MSATLTMSELHAASDLNNMVPLPTNELQATKPPSPEIVKCIPAGAESNTNSSVVDSGDEWDKTEGVGPSRCSTPTTKIGPTWAEVHAATQEEEVAKNQVPTWEEIMNVKPTGETENWDAEDSQSAADLQFEDAIIEEQVVIESVTEEELEPPVAGEPLTQLCEVAGDTMAQKDCQPMLGRCNYSRIAF